MKNIDKTLIGARNDDLAAIIREANYLENLYNTGKSPEEVLAEAKNKLGLTENQSVIAEFEEKTRGINKLQKNFIDTNSLTKRLLDDNLLLDGELEVLNKIEARIGKSLMEVFDLDSEDLYIVEEE